MLGRRGENGGASAGSVVMEKTGPLPGARKVQPRCAWRVGDSQPACPAAEREAATSEQKVAGDWSVECQVTEGRRRRFRYTERIKGGSNRDGGDPGTSERTGLPVARNSQGEPGGPAEEHCKAAR